MKNEKERGMELKMIENVMEVRLPVDEHFYIKKNRIEPLNEEEKGKRICIVTGTHGDELEGQYVCYRLIQRIREEMEHLHGTVDVYPCLNPLGMDSITRGIPQFDLDMNRIFPGDEEGTVYEYAASKIVEDMMDADLCIDIHSSNIFLREIPQVRISETTAANLVPYAKYLNTDFIWVHASATVLQSTLAHSLNSQGVPTLVVEMGVGMRITNDYCNQLTEGILNLMKHLGIWDGTVGEIREPIISADKKVGFVNAERSGVFVPTVEHWSNVKEGQHIGDIFSPLSGEVLERVTACCDGILFTLREYPMVYQGALIARILDNSYT